MNDKMFSFARRNGSNGTRMLGLELHKSRLGAPSLENTLTLIGDTFKSQLVADNTS